MKKLNKLTNKELEIYLNRFSKEELIKLIQKNIYRKKDEYTISEVINWNLLPFEETKIRKDILNWVIKSKMVKVWTWTWKYVISQEEINKIRSL